MLDSHWYRAAKVLNLPRDHLCGASALIIRREQFDSIGKLREGDGNRVLADYAKARFPDYFANHDETALLDEVATIRTNAKQHGLDREDLVGTYLDLSIMYGSGFDHQPWAEPFLLNFSLTPEARIELLRAHVRQSGVNF